MANLEADSVGHSQVVEAEHVAEAESLRRLPWLDGRVGGGYRLLVSRSSAFEN